MSEMKNIDTLRLQNAERMQALYEAGVTIDPIMILKARLDLMTDVLFQALGLSDAVIEGDWELLISGLLDGAEAELQQSGDTVEDTE
jgi:hypothetical protein